MLRTTARAALIYQGHFVSYDLRYLITPLFERHIRRLIENDDPTISWLGTELVDVGLIASQFLAVAIATAERSPWHPIHREERRSAITASDWLNWWKKTAEVKVRQRLLQMLPLCPTIEVEKTLLDCLDSRDFAVLAAGALGGYGAVRSIPFLQLLLSNGSDFIPSWGDYALAKALGQLRDPASVPTLKSFAATTTDSHSCEHAIGSLALIGTPDAEKALVELFSSSANGDDIFDGLILCGTETAMAMVVAEAKRRQDGLAWLCERLNQFAWKSEDNRYFTNIHTTELVECLDAGYQPGTPEETWKLVHGLSRIDSPDVRRLLKKWAGRRGTPEDPPVHASNKRSMSDACFRELMNRGDESAISYVLDQRVNDIDDVYVWIARNNLEAFASVAVAAELRQRFSNAVDRHEIVRLLAYHWYVWRCFRRLSHQ